MTTRTTTRAMMTPTATATNDADVDNFVFDTPKASSLPVTGTTVPNGNPFLFPVRRVYCVGKNYEDHVVEMGGDVKRSKPVFFTKPSFGGVVFAPCGGDGGGDDDDDGAAAAAATTTSTTTPIRYPPNTNNLHYEVELVVAIGTEPKPGSSSNSNSSNSDLMECVYGYAVGIDLTRRDLQGEAKSKGGPWDTGKYFDESAPIGPITPKTKRSGDDNDDESAAIGTKTMVLTVNGEVRQSVVLERMIWKVPEILEELSKSFNLKPGDLIMTGTPSGVGPVVRGDRMVGTIDGLVEQGVDVTLV